MSPSPFWLIATLVDVSEIKGRVCHCHLPVNFHGHVGVRTQMFWVLVETVPAYYTTTLLLSLWVRVGHFLLSGQAVILYMANLHQRMETGCNIWQNNKYIKIIMIQQANIAKACSLSLSLLVQGIKPEWFAHWLVIWNVPSEPMAIFETYSSKVPW